jgi:hypothetical protein
VRPLRDPAEANNPRDAKISNAKRDCDNETATTRCDRKTAKHWDEIVTPDSLRHAAGSSNDDRGNKREIPKEPQAQTTSIAERKGVSAACSAQGLPTQNHALARRRDPLRQ